MKKANEKSIWIKKYRKLLSKYHKRNIDKLVKKLLIKTKNARYSMISRSKKYGVNCDITLDEVRELVLQYYGKPCKYDKNRLVTHNNMVFDHIIPISKGGTSNKDNIQIISKFSNNVKGSLKEELFLVFLGWLETIDPELKKDITIRLAGGLR